MGSRNLGLRCRSSASGIRCNHTSITSDLNEFDVCDDNFLGRMIDERVSYL